MWRSISSISSRALTATGGAWQQSSRQADYAYYKQAAERLGDNRALLSVMRKLLKRSYHTLRELGDDALAPA